MPFVPLHLCILYDDARGHCGRVVPRMKLLLEERAFIVDLHEVSQGPLDLSRFAGLIIGTPVLGLGWKGVGPSARLRTFLESTEGLAGKKVAIFCVYELRPGDTFDRMKNLLFEKGAELVAEQARWIGDLTREEHVIPAECMVRIHQAP